MIKNRLINVTLLPAWFSSLILDDSTDADATFQLKCIRRVVAMTDEPTMPPSRHVAVGKRRLWRMLGEDRSGSKWRSSRRHPIQTPETREGTPVLKVSGKRNSGKSAARNPILRSENKLSIHDFALRQRASSKSAPPLIMMATALARYRIQATWRRTAAVSAASSDSVSPFEAPRGGDARELAGRTPALPRK
jgi:hypothetical protein